MVVMYVYVYTCTYICIYVRVYMYRSNTIHGTVQVRTYVISVLQCRNPAMCACILDILFYVAMECSAERLEWYVY